MFKMLLFFVCVCCVFVVAFVFLFAGQLFLKKNPKDKISVRPPSLSRQGRERGGRVGDAVVATLPSLVYFWSRRMTFPEPLLRVWNINRRNALPAWPHRRRSRRRHGRHTAPKKEERKRESERKNPTNHKQICSVCMRVCVLCEPHEQPQSS